MELSHSQHLKLLVKNAEERIISWKELLADCNKNKINSDWYKDMLRECKNSDEKFLKQIREELTNYNQSLNPSFCYPVFV